MDTIKHSSLVSLATLLLALALSPAVFADRHMGYSMMDDDERAPPGPRRRNSGPAPRSLLHT